MKVIIAGGSGLIGNELSKLLASKGNEIRILTRDVSKNRQAGNDNLKFLQWDAHSVDPLVPYFQDVDAVINLVGENLGTGFWTKKKKQLIIQSRVQAGEALSSAILRSENKPLVFIQASAIGFYGNSKTKKFNEESPSGNDFLSNVATQWENSSIKLDNSSVRRVIIRTGIVLHPQSGALPLMTLPFKLLVGGPLGSGKQILSWIHIQDEIRAIDFVLRNSNLSGPVNLCAPDPQSNAEFGKTLARVIHRPYWFPAPAFALKIALGEKSTMVLDGQYVVPQKLVENNFVFNYPDLERALRDIF
jgi:uncharacterized protein (TIGR01777 family)